MKKQYITGISAVLILALSGCSKHYFDINTNPNAATSAGPDLVLSNALVVTAASQETGFNFLSAWLGYYGQSGSYATGVGDIASYKQTTTFGDGIWLNRYHNLADYDYVEKSATASKQYFYIGAAKIMKALVYQQLVDMFNNVPYNQALQGTSVITPKYDNGQAIYNAITLQIDTAITLMQRADATGSATADVLFGSYFSTGQENAMWIKFANTLKLRILIRQSQVTSNASFIQAELAKITANGGGFLTTDAAVNPPYANNAGQQNPIWGFYTTLTGLPTSGGGADFWKANQYAISWLQNHNDSRLGFIYAPGSGGTYLGSVLGGVSNPPGANASSPGPGILKSVAQSAVILSAAESNFLQAEADIRGWLSGNPLTDYNNGVKSSFEFLGAHNPPIEKVNGGDSIVFTVDQSAALYVQQSDKMTNFTLNSTFADQLACIIRQKWIADDGVTPFESYCDYRRVHLPADIPLSVSQFLDQTPASIPIRFLYPISEYQTNTVNVNAQGTINYHTSPVFWNQ